MTPHRIVLTYKEYEALPADGRRYEIHEGELAVTPAPSPQHQMTSRNLFLILHAHVKAREIGEIVSPSTTLIDRSTKPQLYAHHAIPFFWLVDPEARMLEAFVLGPQGYSLALRAAGTEPVSPPPFSDLGLVLASVWP